MLITCWCDITAFVFRFVLLLLPNPSPTESSASLLVAMITCTLMRKRVTLLQPGSKQDHLERIRADIREFKAARGLDKVVVLWTANTERFTDVTPGDAMCVSRRVATKRRVIRG